MQLQMTSAKRQPFCPGEDELCKSINAILIVWYQFLLIFQYDYLNKWSFRLKKLSHDNLLYCRKNHCISLNEEPFGTSWYKLPVECNWTNDEYILCYCSAALLHESPSSQREVIGGWNSTYSKKYLIIPWFPNFVKAVIRIRCVVCLVTNAYQYAVIFIFNASV